MRKRLSVVAVLGLGTLALAAGPAGAHNAAHFYLPDGTCHEVGSSKESPIVGAGNPNQLPNGQLDLIPGPGDQYGARYAADQGNTPLLPGNCT